MKENIIKLKNDFAIVVDDNNSASLVSIDDINNNYKNILEKENNIEDLENIKAEYNEAIEKNNIHGKKYNKNNIIILCSIIPMLVGLYLLCGVIKLSLITTLIFSGVFYLTNVMSHNPNLIRKIVNKRYNKIINNINGDIELLNKELKKLKEKSNYKIIEENVNISIDNPQKFKKLNNSMFENIKEENNKLSLVKKIK